MPESTNTPIYFSDLNAFQQTETYLGDAHSRAIEAKGNGKEFVVGYWLLEADMFAETGD